MTNREFFLHHLKIETPATINVLKAALGNNLEYRPDPKSKSGLEMLKLFAGESGMLVTFIEQGMVDVGQEMAMDMTPEELVSLFEKNWMMFQEKLSEVSDDDWENKKISMMMGDKEVYADTMVGMLWMLFHDMIHHRGQFAAYLRAMGGKVPSIYGPSADDPGPMANM